MYKALMGGVEIAPSGVMEQRRGHVCSPQRGKRLWSEVRGLPAASARSAMRSATVICRDVRALERTGGRRPLKIFML